MKLLKMTWLALALCSGLNFAADAPTATTTAPEPASPTVDPNAFKVFVLGDSNAANYGPYVIASIDSTAADYGPFNPAPVKNDLSTPDFFVHFKSLMGKCAKDITVFLAKSPQKPSGAYEPLPNGMAYDVVIFQMGTNDSAHRADFPSDDAYLKAIQDGTVKGLEVLRSLYKAKVIYIALPPPIFGAKADDETAALTQRGWSNVNMKKMLPVFRQVAQQNNCKIIDVNAAFVGKEKEFGMGVHYGPEGRKKVTEMYLDAIRGDIDPVKFYDGTSSTELTAIKPGTVRVHTAYINNTLPAKYRPKIMAVLYRDDGGGQLTAVQTKSLDELITPTTHDIEVNLDVPATGKYVIKTFVWRDAAMTTPNNFSTPYLNTLQ